ncbi:hypothetical protein BO94DRAFT_531779 [Aspergillus sclerotioniger CBS 115572]|uniref:Uncharacterized protein n=1 Tax=Aspergillus sclerotioniger CBS 115572 TaxID=1450535 RepID=A0A317X8G9_9EURO|nr:hypothetical protein BO94DRAFT_531779 [Aspergillus sclerotioniger CBS 115572]PWY94839.1 hypothetical protein BO94DRAFT_531779 [Aspergillus sclerotioniger CBS 115572]
MERNIEAARSSNRLQSIARRTKTHPDASVRKIEDCAKKLDRKTALKTSDKNRLIADVKLIKGERLSSNKRTQVKQVLYRDFLIRCIECAELGPNVMVLCSLALGLTGIYGLNQLGMEEFFQKLIARGNWGSPGVMEITRSYNVPDATFFEVGNKRVADLDMECMGVQYSETFPLVSTISTVLPVEIPPAVLSSDQVSATFNVKLDMPFQPDSRASLTLNFEIDREMAWQIVPFYHPESAVIASEVAQTQ